MPTKMGSNMDSIGPTGTAPAVRTGPVMRGSPLRRAGNPRPVKPWGSLAQGGGGRQGSRGREYGQGGGGPARDGDLVEPVEQVIQGEAGAQPDPHAFPDGSGACPQDQRQAAGAVLDDELGEAGPDAVPGNEAPQGPVDAGP